MPRPFQSELVLEERISEANFRAYHVGFDQNSFRLEPLVNLLMDVVPEFAFGMDPQNIPTNEVVRKVRQAARSVYVTDNYDRRGELGEIVLHLLLRDFHGTVPLISKIYFKDTPNATVHGFDGVHVTINGDQKKLWLGESKLYSVGIDGVRALAEDVKAHFAEDYLRQELALISKKIPSTMPEITYWQNLIHENQRLDTIFSSVVVPLVCTYNSSACGRHTSETEEYLSDFIEECSGLKQEFEARNVRTDLDILLLLLPIPDKEALTASFDSKLKGLQV